MGTLLVLLLTATPDAGVPDGGSRSQEALPYEVSALDQLNGFQKATWGMTDGNVRRLFPGSQLASAKHGERSVTLPKTTVGGLAASLGFMFEGPNDGLSMVIVQINQKQKGTPTTEQLCDALRKSLVEKYGEPAKTEDVLGGTKSIWGGERTFVMLLCNSLSLHVTPVSISYLSRDVAERSPEVKSDEL